VKKLVTSINTEAGDESLSPLKIDHSFAACWADLEDRLKPLLPEARPSTQAKDGNAQEKQANAENLTDEDIKILLAVADTGDDGLRKEPAAGLFGMHPERAAHIMEGLESLGFLSPAYNYVYGTSWHLNRRGRAFLVERGLL
jgi:hypothetical protein